MILLLAYNSTTTSTTNYEMHPNVQVKPTYT